jgi:hypothetical protein
MDQYPSASRYAKSFPITEQECFIPPTKRARTNHLEDVSSFTLVNNNNNNCQVPQPACWSFGAARRSSLAHFMEPGVTPAKLDIIIDRGIFDSNPLVSPHVKDDNLDQDRSHQAVTFPMCGNTNNQVILKQKVPPKRDCKPISYQLSTNAIINATTVINKKIEMDWYDGKSTTRLGKNSTEARFRSHQAEGWMEKYKELVRYNELNGHCLVPNQYPENPSLAEVSHFND